MQAVELLPTPTTRGNNHRRNRKTIYLRNGKKEKVCGPTVVGNDFLKLRFKPIGPVSGIQKLLSESDKYWHAYVTNENYLYLRNSYFNYAKLLKRAAPHDPGLSLGEGICNLLHEMDKLIGDKLNVNIDQFDGQLHFTLYKHHKWSDWTLYWFPVKFMEKLNPKLRKLCISFYHDFMLSNGLLTINGQEETFIVLSWLSDIWDDMEKEEKLEFDKELTSYSSGKAFKSLDRLENPPAKYYYKNLSAAISRYQPVNKVERKLLSLLEEGLQFIGKDKPSIMHYEYDPHLEYEPHWSPLNFDRQIRIVYDTSDFFTGHLEDFFNHDQNETYCLTPHTTLVLTTETTTLFQMDDYPERFYRWSEKFLHHVLSI